MSFIGVDLGTTFIKGAVLDLESRTPRHTLRKPFPAQVENAPPLACEFDPDEILAAVRALLDEIAPHAPDCEGLVVCAQMHGMVLMNARGEVQSNCVTWRDQRVVMPDRQGSESYYQIMTRRIAPRAVRQIGNELDPGRPLSYLFWFAEQGDLSPGIVPVSLPDFVLSSMCKSEPGVELTNAGAYGALNLETLDWHAEMIEALGLANLRWPRINELGDVVGTFELNGRKIPCYTPVGDYQCALLGSLFSPSEVSLNIATGSQVSRMTDRLILGEYQTRPFFEGKFLNTFTSPPGGRALNVLVDLLCELPRAQGVNLKDPWETFIEAAEEIDGTDLEIDLNFFPTPRGDRGRIANIRQDNFTIGHVFRAAFENMAESFYDCAQKLDASETWKNLLLSGGLASKLEILRRTIQEKFDTTYRLPPYEEDTLFGLLILAMVFSGRAASIEEAVRSFRVQQ